jgi:hypothetical protein
MLDAVAKSVKAHLIPNEIVPRVCGSNTRRRIVQSPGRSLPCSAIHRSGREDPVADPSGRESVYGTCT